MYASSFAFDETLGEAEVDGPLARLWTFAALADATPSDVVVGESPEHWHPPRNKSPNRLLFMASTDAQRVVDSEGGRLAQWFPSEGDNEGLAPDRA